MMPRDAEATRTRQQAMLVCMLAGLLSGCASTPPAPKPAPRSQACILSPHALHYCRSPGQPMLVLLSGLGNTVADWSPEFLSGLQKFAGVLVYNRRGYPPSRKLDGKPVRASLAAADLDQLLTDLMVNEPVVLVGHSLGGLYANYFARRYPKRVAGVVLIDAASPEEPVGDARFQTRARLQPGSTEALENAGIDASIEETRAAGAFPDLPLLVLTATNHRSSPGWERLWLDLQFSTAAESPRGSQIVAKGAGHYLHKERPAWTAAMIEDFIRAFAPPASAPPTPPDKSSR